MSRIRLFSVALLLAAETFLPPANVCFGAVTFEINLPSTGTFTSPGILEAPPTNVLALHPITLEINPPQLVFFSAGESAQMHVTATFDDLHRETIDSNPEVEYFSSDLSVATVTKMGLILAVGPGDAEVGARFRGLSQAASILVRAPASITAITPIFNFRELDEMVPEIAPLSSKFLSPGQTARLDAVLSLANGEKALVTAAPSTRYLSENLAVAAVGAHGEVQAMGFGTTRIKIENNGVSTFAVVHVDPPDVTPPETGVQFAPPSFVGAEGAVVISILTAVDLPAIDPVGGDAIISDIDFTGYTLDPAPRDLTQFSVYFNILGGRPFTLEEGAQTLRYGSMDKAGNAEVIRSTAVHVDGTPPMTTASIIADSTNLKVFIGRRPVYKECRFGCISRLGHVKS